MGVLDAGLGPQHLQQLWHLGLCQGLLSLAV